VPVPVRTALDEIKHSPAPLLSVVDGAFVVPMKLVFAAALAISAADAARTSEAPCTTSALLKESEDSFWACAGKTRPDLDDGDVPSILEGKDLPTLDDGCDETCHGIANCDSSRKYLCKVEKAAEKLEDKCGGCGPEIYRYFICGLEFETYRDFGGLTCDWADGVYPPDAYCGFDHSHSDGSRQVGIGAAAAFAAFAAL